MSDEGSAGPARRPTGGWKAARWARRLTQVAAFAFFVYLLFAGLQRIEPLPYAGIFFRFDPLAGVATMISARAWLPDFVPILVTLALTVVVGRVWCGWICPLGTLLGWVRFRAAPRRAAQLRPSLRRLKYVLLGTIVVLAALGNLTLLVLDPLALLVRTATTSVIPGFVYVADTLNAEGIGWEPTTGAVTWIEEHLRGTLLPTVQPRYDQAVALALVLLGVVLLNALAPRFWCRYVCPLGALLGLVAKVQVLRPVAGESCGGCVTCARVCGMGAIELAGGEPEEPVADAGRTEQGSARSTDVRVRVVTSECTTCLDCLAACPRPGAMSLAAARRPGPWVRYDPGRREVVVSAAAGVAAAVLFGTGVARAFPRPGLVRPPGAQDEEHFLSHCLRCGECMKVCPTFGLQPSLAEAGLEGIWTPVLKPRLGCCDYACSACGKVCPSGAIPALSLPEKRRQVIGLAVIDRDRCLPWANDTPCIVCEEMCPIPDKAIELVGQHLITRPDGTQDYLSRPKVIAERCIGCGICEYKCPVAGTAAIVVRPSRLGRADAGVAAG